MTPTKPTRSGASRGTVTAPRRGGLLARIPGGRRTVIGAGIVLVAVVVALVVATLPGSDPAPVEQADDGRPGPGISVPANSHVPATLNDDGKIPVGAVFGGYTGETDIPNPRAVPGAVDASEAALQGKLRESCSDPSASMSREDCVLGITLDSLQSFWGDVLHRTGSPKMYSPTVFYSDPATVDCGDSAATKRSFYCSSDSRSYVNVDQWGAVAEVASDISATFGQQYLIAHTYAHHLQDVMGIFAPFADASDTADASVRVELAATCYTGIWMKHAGTLKGADGTALVPQVDEEDYPTVAALNATLDNDWVQGFHGTDTPAADSVPQPTADQAAQWFATGYTSGSMPACDTFSADSL